MIKFTEDQIFSCINDPIKRDHYLIIQKNYTKINLLDNVYGEFVKFIEQTLVLK